MTANEVIARAVDLVEEDHPVTVWRRWIEDVLKDLNPLSKILAEADVNLTIANGEATVNLAALPLFYEVVNMSFKPTGKRPTQLRKLPIYDSYSTGWILRDTTAKLVNLRSSEGQAVVGYYQELTMTESVGEHVFNLPEKYHDLIVRGICSMAMQKEEELDRKQDFYIEYTMGKRRMLAERVVAIEPWYAGALGGEQQ